MAVVGKVSITEKGEGVTCWVLEVEQLLLVIQTYPDQYRVIAVGGIGGD